MVSVACKIQTPVYLHDTECTGGEGEKGKEGGMVPQWVWSELSRLVAGLLVVDDDEPAHEAIK